MLSVQEYEKLIRPKQSLVDFLENSPLRGVELDLSRETDRTRDVDV